jgi:hypothetical protein
MSPRGRRDWHLAIVWTLHRMSGIASHTRYMSIRVTFRNNFFYYLMRPSLWLASALLYLEASIIQAWAVHMGITGSRLSAMSVRWCAPKCPGPPPCWVRAKFIL